MQVASISQASFCQVNFRPANSKSSQAEPYFWSSSRLSGLVIKSGFPSKRSWIENLVVEIPKMVCGFWRLDIPQDQNIGAGHLQFELAGERSAKPGVLYSLLPQKFALPIEGIAGDDNGLIPRDFKLIIAASNNDSCSSVKSVAISPLAEVEYSPTVFTNHCKASRQLRRLRRCCATWLRCGFVSFGHN